MRLVRQLAVLVAFACTARAGAGATPVQAPIAIDGDASDWVPVLANDANAARDGDGSSIPCAYSSDRDCVVDRGTNDLARFAWTWDASSLYLYLERWEAESAWRFFFVVFDVDRDGLAETNEPALYLHASDDTADAWLQRYVPSATAGDPMGDGAGLADGHGLPWDVTGATALPTPGVLDGGLGFEMAIPWPVLGVPPDSALDFHVIAAASSALPGSVRDNMGGADGAVGTTARRTVGLSPGTETSVRPGEVARVVHRACNTGNVPSRLVVVVRSGRGHDLTLTLDRDLDGITDDVLGFDSGGDGSFARSRDDLTAAGDSDGDGVLDLGVLAPGTCVDLTVEESLAANASETETVQFTVEQQEDASARAEVTDVLRVGRVTLGGDAPRRAAPGSSAWFAHALQNNLDLSARIDLVVFAPAGWTCVVHDDPNGDGTPDDATPMLDNDGTGRPDAGLFSGDATAVLIEVAVPAGVPVGTQQPVTVQAVVQGSVRASVVDAVTVSWPLDVGPDHLASAGNARHGEAGGFAYFPHLITNAQPRAANFLLRGTSDLGWPVTFWMDPDGDGRPYDAEALPGWSGLVPGSGGTFRFLARVALPDGLADGTTSRVTVTAEDAADSAVTDSALDDAAVTIVRVHADGALTVDVSALSPCRTAHALAIGLAPSAPDHLFVWRDGTRAARRLTQVTTDASGACVDSFALGAADIGPGWTVEIQRLESRTYVVQDAASFDVEDPLVAGAIDPGAPAYHFVQANVTATAKLRNEAVDRPCEGGELRWVVLDPSRATYLTPAGSFAPYSGTQATSRLTVPVLAPGGAWTALLAVADVTFPMLGPHVVEIHRALTCTETLLASGTLSVVDDEDFDGLDQTQEAGAGTDPVDADSDDDGLLDGADGIGDSDGDGAVDALDCDSDDDGLFDGVESGTWQRHPDTVVGPCAFLDMGPLATTDPDSADTDGGGASDGEEDADGDGRRDAGETDPLDPADDRVTDTDRDGVPDAGEPALGTSSTDADTDDDGLSDGAELTRGTDPAAADTDQDGVPDGTEAGAVVGVADPDGAGPLRGTDVAAFRPDAEPATTTDPSRADTDGGGAPDGAEDADGNGRLDAGERDPRDPTDDSCSIARPAEVEDLRVARLGSLLRVTWRAVADPCMSYRTWTSTSLPGLSADSAGLTDAEHVFAPAGPLVFIVASVTSRLSGEGPTGP